MSKTSLKKNAQDILDHAGITIDGSKPYDIQVHNDNFYSRVFSRGSIGFGESYMDGWWDTEDLSEFFNKVLKVDLAKKISFNATFIFHVLSQFIVNPQKGRRSLKVGEQHYDIGNDLYEKMLDKRMVYTCGYWKSALTLDEAQEAKLDLVCKKLGLKEGMRVLDIGCGWGSFAKFAAEKYKVSVVGITISEEQVELARETCKGLPVEIRFQDYRDTEGEFDAIVSLGMFEHVGYKNYRTYMKKVHELLVPGGLFLLHTIGRNFSAVAADPWIEKYIFPNSMLPSIKQIGGSLEKLFVMEDWHNFGSDYDKTLMAWFKNFDESWEDLEPKHGKLYAGRFYRMWKYYLLVSAGSFRARKNQLWQIVLSKNGVKGGYMSVR